MPTRPLPLSQTKTLRSGAAAGFSLMELLTVISIIVIAVGVAATLRPGSARPSHAMEIVSSMAEAARANAVAAGAPTRVAICVDPAAGAKYLRYVLSLVGADGDPSTAGWVISDRGRALPEGTIFWPEYGTPIDASATGQSMKLDLTSLAIRQDGTSGSTCVFIEFNALGQSSSETGIQWVFAKAVADDTGARPLIPVELDRDGFILRRTGRFAYFRSPGEITAPTATP